MKKYLLFVLLTGCYLLQAVNGELITQQDRKIMKVWGTHQERGEAQGFLLAENIMTLFDDYIFNYTFSSNSFYYNQIIQLVNSSYTYEPEYITEMEGILAGMESAGIDMTFAGLNRDLNVDDLKMVNAIIDIAGFSKLRGKFGCSTLVSWGEATQEDSELNGELVISRLLDWSANQALIDNSLLIIHEPSELDEQKWMSFTYPGLIGGLTALNEEGVFAELNMGNASGTSQAPYSPVLLDIRSGIEKIDFNSDGSSNYEDVYSALEAVTPSNGFIIMVTNPTVETNPAICIEVNAEGITSRDVTENTALQGNNLASTNHFRKLITPTYCYRYNNLINATETDSYFNVESNYQTLIQSAGLTGNMMAIQYVPSLDVLKWSTYTNHAAYLNDLTSYSVSSLFNGELTPNTNDNIEPVTSMLNQNYPNPFNPETTISYNVAEAGKVSLDVYNIKGQLVKELVNDYSQVGTHNVVWNGTDKNENNVSSGLYFYRIKNAGRIDIKKMILMK